MKKRKPGPTRRRRAPTAPSGLSDDGTAFQPPSAAPAPLVAHVELGAAGRLVIPVAMRTALGMKPGDKLTMRLERDQLSVYTYDVAIRRVQDQMKKFDPGNKLSVDEFLRFKREEAAKEEAEMDRWTRDE